MTVYLCGGINGLSDGAAKDWREQAKALLPYCTVLDPMRRDYRGGESANVNAIVSGDLEDIGACDALLVNAMRPSWGTAMEIVYAHQAGKRIVAFTDAERLSPWLVFHCTRICATLERAIEKLGDCNCGDGDVFDFLNCPMHS